MSKAVPKRFTVHPTLLMLAVLKRGRRLATRDITSKEQGDQMRHYAVGAALSEFGPLSQKEVSERIVMDPSDLVPIIDKMEQVRLVVRLRDPKDRRRYCVTLTEEGHNFMHGMDEFFSKKAHDFLSPLTPEEGQQFMALLRKLLR